MTDHTPSDSVAQSAECADFERLLPDYLEGTTSDEVRAAMDAHRTWCVHCDSMAIDLDHLVQSAAALPPLTPSRDLWRGIDSRLDATVVALPVATPLARPRRTYSTATIAIAATMLVAVTSGITWRISRTSAQSDVVRAALPATANANSDATIPSANALRSTDTIGPVLSADAPVAANLVATSQADVDLIYEREIAALRRVVNERVADLDAVTVAELKRNLEIIDAAIADSRRALQRDPRSRLLSSQLDRTLEAKLALMRRVAML